MFCLLGEITSQWFISKQTLKQWRQKWWVMFLHFDVNYFVFSQYCRLFILCWYVFMFLFSPTSDGAACVILASEDFVRRHNLQPQAVQIIGQAVCTDFSSTFNDKSCMKVVSLQVSAALYFYPFSRCCTLRSELAMKLHVQQLLSCYLKSMQRWSYNCCRCQLNVLKSVLTMRLACCY